MFVSDRRGDDPARRPRRVLRVGRAARRPARCAAAGDRRRRRRARRQLRGQGAAACARRWAAARRGALCPQRDRRAAADVGLLRGQQGRVRGLRATPRRWSRASRSTRRSSTSAACAGSPARRSRSPRGCAREVRDEVGLPITVGVARTKFLAKVASGVAKPDGLLVVPPDGELEFLHPLPVERLWGVGEVTAEKLRDRGIRTVGEVADAAARPRWSRCSAARRAAPARARAQPRPARRSRSAGAAARSARSARSAARRSRPRRSTPSWSASSTASPGGCASAGPRRPHGHAAAALRRLHPRDPLAHAAPGDATHARPCWPPPAPCWPTAHAADRATGRHARRHRRRQPRRTTARPARAAVRQGQQRRAGQRARRRPRQVRHRAITRGVLLGRDQGLTVPMLPD